MSIVLLGCSDNALQYNSEDFSQYSAFGCEGGFVPVVFDGDLAFDSSTSMYDLSLLFSGSGSQLSESVIQSLTTSLTAVSDFSVQSVSMYVAAYLSFFVTGLGTGYVLRIMRRV